MKSIRESLEDAFWGRKNGYAILQLKDTLQIEHAYEWFASIEELKSMGKKPDPEHYELVYSGELDYIPEKVEILLEYLYQRFNVDIPKDFEGHSLSVSDIVVVKDNETVQFWFVDAIGFTELEDFEWK